MRRSAFRNNIHRRSFLGGLAALGLSGCAHKTGALPATPQTRTIPPLASYDALPKLMPVRAETDRIFRTTVCLRPFRAAGPRMDVEKVGDKTVVHNYGHGGSGWSLSWGSSSLAVERALGTGERDVAVIGCGALGLTSAILAQRAGARVTIYAKERPPDVRSARATGSWTPDSRIALTNAVSPDFPGLWETMCRRSFHTYESYLGMAGNPVEWMDLYMLSDQDETNETRSGPRHEDTLDFVRYSDRVRDLNPGQQDLPPGSHPFPVAFATRTSRLRFNVAAYSRQLVNDFLVEGGHFEHVEFHEPNELLRLSQQVIINCTGYGARALWKDESIVPVRGQIAWLIPQPEVDYGLIYNGLLVMARRDGIVVQQGLSDMEGYNDANETPDRAAAEASVRKAAEFFARMKRA